MHFLKAIGASPDIEAWLVARGEASWQLARVVRAGGREARVVDEREETHAVQIPARYLGDTTRLVVGDWVAVDLARAVVCDLMPRKTVFERRKVGRREASQIVAANVDLAAIVMSLDGDFSARRVSRYLVLARGAGVGASVWLTKAAGCGDVETRVDEVRRAAVDAEVHAIDVLAGLGVDALEQLLRPGQTVVLLGSSGVGKSTLANHLLGRAATATGDVRARDDKGRHTTTHRELFALPNGGALIDTPGLRELGLVGDEASVDDAFDDVTQAAAYCRFRDCRHAGEPGCGVDEAIARGELDRARVDEAAQLKRELARSNERLRERAQKQVGRRGALDLRAALKQKGRL